MDDEDVAIFTNRSSACRSSSFAKPSLGDLANKWSKNTLVSKKSDSIRLLIGLALTFHFILIPSLPDKFFIVVRQVCFYLSFHMS